MTVKFYVKQIDTETNETSEKFLFSQNSGLMMIGLKIADQGTVYQVDALEWIDKKKGILKAVCLEVPQ